MFDLNTDEICDQCQQARAEYKVSGCYGTFFLYHLCRKCADYAESKCVEAKTSDIFLKVPLSN